MYILEELILFIEVLIPIENISILPDICRNTKRILLVHTAFLTSDYIQKIGIDKYREINNYIIDTVSKGIRLSSDIRVVEISSGIVSKLESFLNASNHDLRFKHDDYAILKLKEEKSISKLADVLILRIYALTGKYMQNQSIYALGDFLLKAKSKEVIQINSIRKVIRGYAHAKNISEFILKWIRSNDPLPNSPLDAVTHQIDILEMANQISNQYELPDVIHNIDFAKEPNCYSADPSIFRTKLKNYNIPILSFKNL